MMAMTEPGSPAVDLYLDLMKKCLTRSIFEERYSPVRPPKLFLRRVAYALANGVLSRLQLEVVRRAKEVDVHRRALGRDWPAEAETMIGLRRLDNLECCIRQAVADGVPGDLIETGVWRGGATIFMRAVLAVLGVRDRVVWVADSFRGLPKPDAKAYPADAGDRLWENACLGIPLEEVRNNFRRYGLLDEQVRFLEGWFRETMPNAPIKNLAVLRLDGDMYESTMEVLKHLYARVSVGGYVIVDDYRLERCRAAVIEFREQNGIQDEIVDIDGTAAFWKRGAGSRGLQRSGGWSL